MPVTACCKETCTAASAPFVASLVWWNLPSSVRYLPRDNNVMRHMVDCHRPTVRLCVPLSLQLSVCLDHQHNKEKHLHHNNTTCRAQHLFCHHFASLVRLLSYDCLTVPSDCASVRPTFPATLCTPSQASPQTHLLPACCRLLLLLHSCTGAGSQWCGSHSLGK